MRFLQAACLARASTRASFLLRNQAKHIIPNRNSLDVVLRSEMVERAKAGDKCVFTGTFIVVPDVAQLGLPGVNAEMMRQAGSGGRGGVMGGAGMGVSGLKALGVKDLTYKTAFLACMVQSADTKVGSFGCSV